MSGVKMHVNQNRISYDIHMEFTKNTVKFRPKIYISYKIEHSVYHAFYIWYLYKNLYNWYSCQLTVVWTPPVAFAPCRHPKASLFEITANGLKAYQILYSLNVSTIIQNIFVQCFLLSLIVKFRFKRKGRKDISSHILVSYAVCTVLLSSKLRNKLSL